MTRHDQSNALEQVLQVLAEAGFEGMAQAMQILLNEAMKLERAQTLQAGPYERTGKRRGYANGLKTKRVTAGSVNWS